MELQSKINGVDTQLTPLWSALLLLDSTSECGRVFHNQAVFELPPNTVISISVSQKNNVLFELLVEAATAPGDSQTQCLQSLLEPALSHSCVHAVAGPFENVQASYPGPSETEMQMHVRYAVTLPVVDSTYQGQLRYSPSVSSTFVFFLVQTTALRVFELDSGFAVPMDLIEDVEPEDVRCQLQTAYVVSLQSNRTYAIAVGPSFANEMMLLVEHMFDFVTQDWLISCS